MALSLVTGQNVSGSGTSSVTSAHFNNVVVAGNAIVVGVVTNNASGAGASSITDNASSVYVKKGTTYFANGNTLEIWVSASALSTGQPTQQVTGTATNTADSISFVAQEFNGFAGAVYIDQQSNTTATATTSITTSNVTTTSANELLLGLGAQNNTNRPYTAGAGYSIINQINGSAGLSLEYELVTATGSYNANMTIDTAQNWDLSLFTLSPTAATSAILTINVSDSTTLTETTNSTIIVTPLIAVSNNIVSSESLTVSAVQLATPTISISNTVTSSEIVAVFIASGGAYVSDNIATSDVATLILSSSLISVTDSIATSETSTVARGSAIAAQVNVTDAISLSEATNFSIITTPPPIVSSSDSTTTSENVTIQTSSPLTFVTGQVTGGGGTGLAVTPHFNNTITTGNAIFVSVVTADVATGATSVTDNQGNIFTRLGTSFAADGLTTELWASFNVSSSGAATQQVTATAVNAADYITAIAIEMNGFSGNASLFEAQAKVEGSFTSSLTTPQLTTSAAYDLLLATAAQNNTNRPYAVGTGFNQLSYINGNAGQALEYALTTSAGNYSASYSVDQPVAMTLVLWAISSTKASLPALSIATNDGVSTSDAANILQANLAINVTDAITTSEAVALYALPLPLSINTSDATSTSEVITKLSLSFNIAASDKSFTSEALQLYAAGFGTVFLNESVASSEAVSVLIPNLLITQSVLVVYSDSTQAYSGASIAVSDSAASSEVITANTARAIIPSDASSLTESLALTVVSQKQIYDGSNISDNAIVSIANPANLQINVFDNSGSGDSVSVIATNSLGLVTGQVITAVAQGSVTPAHFSGVVKAGNAIVVAITTNSATADCSSVTDNANNTYIQVGKDYAANGTTIALWIAYNAASTGSGTQTVTATASVSTAYIAVAAMEVFGLASAGYFDKQSSTTTGNGTALSVPNIQTTTPNELLLAVAAQAGTNRPYVAGTGYSIVTQNGGLAGIAVESQTVVGAGLYSASASIDIAEPWSLSLFTLSPSAPAGPTLLITMGDNVATNDATKVLPDYKIQPTDSTTVSETVSVFIPTLVISVAETINSFESSGGQAIASGGFANFAFGAYPSGYSFTTARTITIALTQQINVSDNVASSETVAALPSLSISASDLIASDDSALNLTLVNLISTSDFTYLPEVLNMNGVFGIQSTETTVSNEALNVVARSPSTYIAIASDNIATTDSNAQYITTLLVTAIDNVALTDSTAVKILSLISLTEAVTISEQLALFSSYDVRGSDAVSTSESLSFLEQSHITQTDLITTADIPAVTFLAAINSNDSIVATEQNAVIVPFVLIAVSDAITYSEVILATNANFVTASDSSTTTDSASVNAQVTLTANDAAQLSEATAINVPVTIPVNDLITLNESIQLQPISYISSYEYVLWSENSTVQNPLEEIRVSDNTTITEAIGISELVMLQINDSSAVADLPSVLIPILYAGLYEGVRLSEAALIQPQVSVSTTETVSGTDAATIQIQTQITVSDASTLSDVSKLLSISYITQSDAISSTETYSVAPELKVSVNEAAATIDPISASPVSFVRSSDSVITSENSQALNVYNIHASDAVAVSEIIVSNEDVQTYFIKLRPLRLSVDLAPSTIKITLQGKI